MLRSSGSSSAWRRRWSVGPGPVETELALAHHTPAMRADYHATIPVARYATADEVAGAVAYLSADEASYVNGETLYVDGGFLASGVDVGSAQRLAQRDDPRK